MSVANIQSNNALAQFEALSREEEKYQNLAKQYDTKRTKLEEQLRQLRIQQKQYSQETREASDALGKYNREKTFLQQQQVKLEQQLEEERIQLENCVAETKSVTLHHTNNKKQYCKELELLNDELSTLLQQQEEVRLQRMLKNNKESLVVLRRLFEQKKLLPNERLDHAIDNFNNAKNEFDNSIQERIQLEKTIDNLRSRALQQHSMNNGTKLTEESLLDLERVWKSQQNHDDNDDANNATTTTTDPVHVQLFYGNHQQGNNFEHDEDDNTNMMYE